MTRVKKGQSFKVPFDKIVEAIAGLGVPGLVLLTAMAISGWAGAAALTTALAALGGPLGMLGGIAVLGILALAAHGLSEFGFEKIAVSVIKRLRKQGRRRADVISQIRSFPISSGMKVKILARIEKVWPRK